MISQTRNVRRVSFIAWVKDPDGNAISYYDGLPVYSSTAEDKNEPGDVIRKIPAQPGTVETSLLLKGERGIFIAHPTPQTDIIDLPGYRDPILLEWEENKQRDGVVVILKVENFPPTIPTFPGNAERFTDLTPDPLHTTPWDRLPQPKEITYSRIGYHLTGEGKPIGYAYTAFMASEEGRIYRFSDGSLFIPGPNRQFKVREYDDVIEIEKM